MKKKVENVTHNVNLNNAQDYPNVGISRLDFLNNYYYKSIQCQKEKMDIICEGGREFHQKSGLRRKKNQVEV